MKKLAFFLPVLALSFSNALTPSRQFAWGFQSPNLLPNWSFENPLEFWIFQPASGFTGDVHCKSGSGTPSAPSAYRGNFMAKVTGTSGSSAFQPLTSDRFRVAEATTYTLSFYYQTQGSVTGSVRASAIWSSDAQGSESYGTLTSSAIGTSSSWNLYSFTFTLPANAQYLQIALSDFAANSSATVYYDDVVLEEGNLSTSQASNNRLKISQSVTYGDGLDRALQSQSPISTNRFYVLAGGTGFDDFARPESTFLPTPTSLFSIAPVANLASNANGYYNSDAQAFNANGYAFSHVRYSSDAASRVLESTSPDLAWQFGNGHTRASDFYYVNDSLVPANIEVPATNSSICKYRFDWSRSPDSTYTLTWTNKLGQVIRRATNLSRNTSAANTWKWAGTHYEYYPMGNLKKTYTPIDDSAGTSNFAEIKEYDAMGRLISSQSPDRSQTLYWYNRAGQLRYSQDAQQRLINKYTYVDYDYLGRPVSEGTQVLTAAPPQDSVDADTYSQGPKVEEIGYLYDDTAGFQARTGLSFQSLLGSVANTLSPTYLNHRLFCKYHTNAENTLAGFAAQDKLVADFFTYDSLGNITVAYKYIGPVRDPLKRIQDCAYTYDSRNRLKSFTNHASATEATVSTTQSYEYDFLDRITGIRGPNGNYLSRYFPNDWGTMNAVELGGLDNGDSSTYIDYWYHSQGGVKEIQATSAIGSSSKHYFQQFLGYNTKAFDVSGVPASTPRFDGSITQQVYKYAAGDLSQPVRALNYQYDQSDRMLSANAYQNSNSGALDGNEDILSSSLSMQSTDAMSTSMQYDLNGRILGQRGASVSAADSAQYAYNNYSYELNHVTGKLNTSGSRNLSATNNFTYDAKGGMVRDLSKHLSIAYGWNNLPLTFTVDSVAPKGVVRCCTFSADFMPLNFKVSYPSISQYQFYDADGNRVSRIEVESKLNQSMPFIYRGTYYVYTGPGMLKEWREDYFQSKQVKKTNVIVSLFGQTATIGRIRPDGKYEFFVKNHLGSTMRTVDDRGQYYNGSEKAYDYLSYGPYRLLKTGSDTTDVRQKWTGKELELATGLYAFGARWYDPDLGIFLSTDAVRQYFNPYSYGMGDPINGFDPDGNCWNPLSGSCWEDWGHGIAEAGRFSGREVKRFDRWAGGYGDGDEDNLLRQMYRGVVHGNGAPCSDDPTNCTEATRAGTLTIGAGYNSDDDGFYVNVGKNLSFGPGSTAYINGIRERKIEASLQNTQANFDEFFNNAAMRRTLQDPCEDGSCIYPSNKFAPILDPVHDALNSPPVQMAMMMPMAMSGAGEVILGSEVAAGGLTRIYSAGTGGVAAISLEQANAVAQAAGIDMRMFELAYEAGPNYGFISQTGSGALWRAANGKILLTLQDAGLASEKAALETIAHELNHVRGVFQTGFPSSEEAAEAAAQAAGKNFKY